MARIKYYNATTKTWEYADMAFGSGHTPIKGVDYWTEADKAEIINEVIDAIGGATGGDVIGNVDSNNNIVLTGSLSAGTYTLRYEHDDGTLTEIGSFTVGNTGPAYTNLADINSADWLTNKRINSSKNIVDVTEDQSGGKTCIVTNFISRAGVSKLHIKGLNIIDNASASQNYGRLYLYDDTATPISVTYQPSAGISGKTHYTVADYDSSVVILDVATLLEDWGGNNANATRLRLGGFLTGAAEDVIITADQPIV